VSSSKKPAPLRRSTRAGTPLQPKSARAPRLPSTTSATSATAGRANSKPISEKGRPAPAASAAQTTLNQEAYRLLEEAIVTLELEPGSVVSEASLSERIGIGTTPIREALQRLAREYLVQILPRRGVVVTSIDVRMQLQVLETRRELDRLIARTAARRGTAGERQEIGALGERIARTARKGDVRTFVRIDAELNQRTAAAARNEIAANAVAALHAVSRRFWFYHHVNSPLSGETLTRHVELARAVASGDESRAAHASDALLEHLFAFARATLPEV
jgi:DNA-binding GntR family transcriptional regulator